MKTTPFIIATAAAAGIVGADIMWMTGELLTHLDIISDTTYVWWRLGVLASLIIGLIITLVSLVRYIQNGYVMADKTIEKEQLREKCKSKKRMKVFGPSKNNC